MSAALEMPPERAEGMMPGLALLRIRSEALDLDSHWSDVRRPGRILRILRSRSFAWVTALLVAAGAVGVAGVQIQGSARQVDLLGAQLGSAQARATSAEQALSAATQKTTALHGKLSGLERRLEALEAAKTRTVVKTKTVTRTVTRWIPNGKGIVVEITGFEGMVQIHDVQMTHAYGYSDLIGIAVNRSGRSISYAQLGCTFLDADGRVLANGIDNKQSWQPGQSWGFDCSGQVDATGGILRVDEMS